MNYRSQYLLIDQEGMPCEIVFFTTDYALEQGLCNVDTNRVLLSVSMYSEWRSLVGGHSDYQKKFFDNLKKVSDFGLPEF